MLFAGLGVFLAWRHNDAAQNKHWKMVIPCQFEDARDFSEGLAAVKLNGKWGYINKTGEIIIPCQFDYARDFSEGLASVELNDKCGYIDKSGKVAIPYDFVEAYSFSEGLAFVKSSDKRGYIDKSGKEVMSYKCQGISSFSEGLACVFKDGQYGFVDKTTKIVIPFTFDDINNFNGGFASYGQYQRHLWYKISYAWNTFEELMDAFKDRLTGTFRFDHIGLGNMEMSMLKMKYGIIDKTGRIIISPQFDDIGNFSEGLVSVKINEEWGFIEIVSLKNKGLNR